ncbi:hypothetical protein [Aneurinibacillus aneurinilyticus]|uniref:Uncharacterized protein n=1 Tax=Aneurinibacillus aneurinilyticus TaxID=1391 RepID=A0A848CV58_ANEAE|nr:hypothetical protein [Aneurinibacillus aneurinilyticus]NME98841.1 hypothetical protein [Aneurinibacillus aneurinilyticus]
MSFTEPIATLYRMRALENEGDDIEVIEDILNELAFNGRNTIIPDLCLVMQKRNNRIDFQKRWR